MSTDFYKTYPAFYSYLRIHKDEPTALPKLEAEAFSIKAPLREALGLPDTGREGINLGAVSLDFCKQARKDFARICREEGSEELALAFEDDMLMRENKTQDGARLSRAFLRLVSKTGKTYKLGHMSYTVARLERRLQDIYTTVKASEKQFFISTNFVDMLNCSTGSFTSCFRPGGAYSAAAMSMALSERVAMLYTTKTDSTKVISRAWVVFAEDFSGFFILRTYGDWPKSASTAASQWLTDRLSAKFGWTSVWKSRPDKGVFLGTDLQFMDHLTSKGSMYTDPVATANWYNPDGKTTEFGFLPTYAMPKCALCGKENQGPNLACRSCMSKVSRCVFCGKNTYAGGQVCPGCAKQNHASPGIKQWCNICGKPFKGGPLQVYCTSCIHSFTQTECATCGKSSSMLYPNKGKWECSECIDSARADRRTELNSRDVILEYLKVRNCGDSLHPIPSTLKNLLNKAGLEVPEAPGSSRKARKKSVTTERGVAFHAAAPLRAAAVAA